MLSDERPAELVLSARVGHQPHFPGSIHDDDAAKKYGYRGALVPGIVVYAHMSGLVVSSWGLPWIERGTMTSQSRRPVYDGDQITILAEPVAAGPDGSAVNMQIKDAAGNTVATGRATLPKEKPQPPDLGAFPVRPIADDPPKVAAGGFKEGDRFGSGEVEVTEELLNESMNYFAQSWPGYRENGILHPTHLQRISTRHALSSYSLATPSIFVSGTAQHFHIVRLGDRLTTSGVIDAVYEKNGNHYYDSTHVVICNGATPAALIHRVSIYAARRRDD